MRNAQDFRVVNCPYWNDRTAVNQEQAQPNRKDLGRASADCRLQRIRLVCYQMFKFVHAADIHLDSPLRGLSAYEGAPLETLRGATRAAFRNLIDLTIREEAAFIVLAGDLYDGTWRDYQTGLFFVSEMGRLRAAGIQAFLLHGNHDAESEITKPLRLPDNVAVFPARAAKTFVIKELKVALHGRSFQTPATMENLVPSYPDPLDGHLNIGVLHTALEGHSEHAAYAPCSLQELIAKGYQYWALGHVHEHAIPSQNPWVVFPGNLQGRHARELGPRGAMLVGVKDSSIKSVERVFTDVLRWHELTIDLSSATTLEQAAELVQGSLVQAVEAGTDGRPLAIRISLTGKTAVHGALFEEETEFCANVRAIAVGNARDAAWVEKVLVMTEPLPTQLPAAHDALAELEAMIASVATDKATLDGLSEQLKTMMARLPLELRTSSVPELAAIRENRIGDIANDMKSPVSAWISRAK